MIPIFPMHYCVFVLIPPTDDIDGAVAAALEPFDEALEVEPYRVHLDHAAVTRMAGHYRIPAAHLHELAKKLPDWTGRDGGVDRDGLYYLSTCNPDGYWDWYEIGGRFDGYIPYARRNVIRAGTLAKSDTLSRCLPCYVVTPPGEWLEQERSYFEGGGTDIRTEKMVDANWLRLVRDTLREHADHLVVCVDIHS